MEIFNASRNPRRALRQALCAAALLSIVAVPAARGGTAQSSFVVTGNVIANCTIGTTGISFTYDPVVANASANATGTGGTVTIACTKGSGPTIGLSTGNNAAQATLAGASRAMSMTAGTTTSYLQYDVRWPGTSTSWSNAGAGLFNPGAPTSKAPRTFNMDAVAIGGQDVPVGTYSDNVTATVNF